LTMEGATNAFTIDYNDTTRLTLDSSGNLGLGVTPSAWAASFKAQQIGNVSSIWMASNTTGISNNFFFDGASKYITTNFATSYEQGAGAHQWYTAPSGTAGNAISFSQAMTLDASGRLLVGTTGDIAAGGYFGVAQFRGAFPAIVLSGTEASAKIWQIAENAGALAFYNATDGERARIDSSGNLLVGTTSGSSARIVASESGNASSLSLLNTDTAMTSNVLSIYPNRNTSNGTYNLIGAGVNGVGNRFVVADSGNVTNTNNSYGAISDAKLKENVTDATPKLDKLNQVRVVNFNMIGDKQKQIGVIAQELESIFPGMVDESPDRDTEGNDLGTTTKSVKYSVFVPMLIKAMQEQQALIQTLTSRVAALESN